MSSAREGSDGTRLISLADELMYTVKNTTKNDIRFMTVENQVSSS